MKLVLAAIIMLLLFLVLFFFVVKQVPTYKHWQVLKDNTRFSRLVDGKITKRKKKKKNPIALDPR